VLAGAVSEDSGGEVHTTPWARKVISSRPLDYNASIKDILLATSSMAIEQRAWRKYDSRAYIESSRACRSFAGPTVYTALDYLNYMQEYEQQQERIRHERVQQFKSSLAPASTMSARIVAKCGLIRHRLKRLKSLEMARHKLMHHVCKTAKEIYSMPHLSSRRSLVSDKAVLSLFDIDVIPDKREDDGHGGRKKGSNDKSAKKLQPSAHFPMIDRLAEIVAGRLAVLEMLEAAAIEGRENEGSYWRWIDSSAKDVGYGPNDYVDAIKRRPLSPSSAAVGDASSYQILVEQAISGSKGMVSSLEDVVETMLIGEQLSREDVHAVVRKVDADLSDLTTRVKLLKSKTVSRGSGQIAEISSPPSRTSQSSSSSSSYSSSPNKTHGGKADQTMSKVRIEDDPLYRILQLRYSGCPTDVYGALALLRERNEKILQGIASACGSSSSCPFEISILK
jgi:hypothetical protein